MNPSFTIVFVCEHGAAKSILAATYFNQLAQEMEINFHALARGTNPDPALSFQTITGLDQDGLTPIESTPQKLTISDIQSAHCVISFCTLPAEFQQHVSPEYWNDVPPVSENYQKARDTILVHIYELLKSLG